MNTQERQKVITALKASSRRVPGGAPHYQGAWSRGYLARLQGKSSVSPYQKIHSLSYRAFRRYWLAGWEAANADARQQAPSHF